MESGLSASGINQSHSSQSKYAGEHLTNRLYLEDAYCTDNDAVIVAVTVDGLILDRTCMYPGGGGQPPDTGEIILSSGESLRIDTVAKDPDGNLVHQCSNPISLDLAGSDCLVRLDSQRRFGLMRYHTALHVFNTVMLRSFDGWITGVGIGSESSHIDFKVDNYNDEMRSQLEVQVNVVLNRSLPVKTYFITEAEFRQRPDLIRTLDVAPPIENGRIRVVEVEGFEAQACGGTHVRNTAEVGQLMIKKVKSKGKNNRRFFVELSESGQGKQHL